LIGDHWTRGLSESRKVTQATSLKILREQGYANVPDTDPWGKPYVLDPVLTSGAKPRDNDDVCLQPGGLWDRCL